MPDTISFWNQFIQYNTAIFPFQWILASLALISVLMIIFSKKDVFSIILKTVLAVSFSFVGIVFFLIYGASILAKIFGIVFLLIGLFAFIDIFRNKIIFSVGDEKRKKYSILLWVVIVFFIYPLTGMALGHHYPAMCFPIATPCPLTMLAIVLIGTTKPNRYRNAILIMLLPWAILSIFKLFGFYNCYEDGFVFISGVWGVALLISQKKNKKTTQTMDYSKKNG